MPSGDASPATLDLTLRDALSRALKFNLALAESDANTRLTRAQRLQALSELLPSIHARAGITEQQVNLAAFGFSGFPGIPTVVGPFKVVDARSYFNEQLSFSGFRSWRAGALAVRAAELNYKDARDQVVQVVVELYLQAIAGAARLEAQRAQLQTANELFRQASDQKEAGVAAGIDVLRAQVEMQSQQQRLIYFEGEAEKQRIAVARAIGLPPGQPFRLADQIPYAPLPANVDLQASLQVAYKERSDYQAAEASLKSAEMQRSAARAQRLPSVSLNADYGVIGPSPVNAHGTFTVAGGVSVPIFDGGRIRAGVEQASALVDQRRAEREDLRGRIDADVRSAFLDLRSAARQVEVAASSVDLAKRALTQTRDRFVAGVTNNLEVVQAQESLAMANQNYITALYSLNSAKAALARARGDGDEVITRALTGK